MSEEETTGVPDEELEVEEVNAEAEAEAEEITLIEGDEDWDDLDEDEPGYTSFDVRVFFHTGAALTVPVDTQTSVLDLRKKLEKEYERRTYGSVCLVNGRTAAADYEDSQFLSPGDIITFSGSVKGG